MSTTIQIGEAEVRVVPEAIYAFQFFTHHSPEMISEMECFMEVARGKKCFFDIGALYGVFSTVFVALNPGSKAYAFEPHPDSFKTLQGNAALTEGIEPRLEALSDYNGFLPMHQEWGMHLVAGYGGPPDTPADVNEGKHYCIIGDDFCFSRASYSDLFKIDVEGHEMKVLRGLRRVLTDLTPTILLEIHPERLKAEGDSVDGLLALLSGIGYTQALDTRTKQATTFEDISRIEQDSRIIFT